MRIKFKINNINNIAVFFAAAISFYIVLLGVNAVCNLFAYGTSLDSLAVFGIYALMIVMAVVPVFSHLNGKHWIIFFAFIMIGVFGCVAHPENILVIFKSIMIYASFFLVGAALQDHGRLEYYVGISVIIATIFGALHVIFSLIILSSYLHDMTGAYSLLPAAILAVYFALSKRKLFYYIIFAVSFLEIMTMGVRGPMLIYIIAMSVIIFRYLNKGYPRILFFLITSLIVGFFVSGSYVLLLKAANNFFIRLGLSNRAIVKLLDNSFFEDNGRKEITETVFRAINERPFIGHGIFYDRIIIHGYTHNVVTEMILDFGYILGIAAFIFVLWRAVKLLKKTKGNMFRFSLVIMLISLSLGQNMVSGSYLENEFFFLMLGMSFNDKLWPDETDSLTLIQH